MPYGTYVIREVAAPTGYKPNESEHVIQVRKAELHYIGANWAEPNREDWDSVMWDGYWML